MKIWKFVNYVGFSIIIQAAEISRRRARVREFSNPENVAKLHASEAKMQELKANMAVLGKEASAALAAVDAQQQRLTLQRLVAMVGLDLILIGQNIIQSIQ